MHRWLKTFRSDHLDAADNTAFLRELEHILVEQFDRKFAKLRGLELVPVDSSISPEKESVVARGFDSLGKAKRMVDLSDDLPMVNVRGAETAIPMTSHGAAFGYSIDELRAMASLNRPLDRDRAEAARKVLNQKLDEVIAIGDADAGQKGLTNLASANSFNLIDNGSGSVKWADKSPDQILADLNGMITKVVVDSKEIEKPTRIVMPTAEYRQISQTARSPVSDTTILQFFKANNPDVDVQSWERLTLGDPTGLLSRIIAYDPKLMNVRLLMSIMFEMQAPQLVNMAYKVNCRFKTGGVFAPYPKSICYADGSA